MTTMHDYERKLRDARQFKSEWNQKAQRLYEVSCGVDPGTHVRRDFEEARTNYLLVNVHLKTAALIGQYRASRVRFRNVPHGIEDYFNDFILPNAVHDIEDLLKDRFITGLGTLAVGSESGRAFLYRIDPLDIWWDPNTSLRRPAWVVRRLWLGDQPVYEYWDAEVHAFFTPEEVIHEELNPLHFIPIKMVPNLMVPRIAFPISDIELAYPQQCILNEVRRTLLEHARRGAGFFEARESDADPSEVNKLEEGGSPIVYTRSGNAINPKPSPPINPEWFQLEALMKADLDAQQGVSEYLRGAMPVANNIRFARSPRCAEPTHSGRREPPRGAIRMGKPCLAHRRPYQ